MNNEALYPPIQPFAMHEISVAAPHVLYVEESGNPDGVPVVFLHGGPGAGCKPAQRRSFDPARYRIVLFDQRGCGRSSPSAALEGNDTQALIGDIERIRDHLGIDRWMVAGGSWGSLLSLAYAIAHPDRCRALRVHGIFLGRPQEVRFWFHGIGTLFPDAFEAFANHVEPHERGDLLTAYHTRLIDPDPQVHASRAGAARIFRPHADPVAQRCACERADAAKGGVGDFAHLRALLRERVLPSENHVLDNIARIRHLPCEIVQGRYDVVTPMQGAWDLHRAWPEARFTLVELANHVATPRLPISAPRCGRPPTGWPMGRTCRRSKPTSPACPPFPGRVRRWHRAGWLSDETGFDRLWSRDLTVADAPAVLRTSLTERVCGFAFRPGSRDILFTTDSGGDEHHQLNLLREGLLRPNR
ncbi:MAG: prolyl aminopeptidase [Alphaproteobacteria bacterium]|nr:prolyl aminopeptidase [Alphaproteobacteria bacterium]